MSETMDHPPESPAGAQGPPRGRGWAPGDPRFVVVEQSPRPASPPHYLVLDRLWAWREVAVPRFRGLGSGTYNRALAERVATECEGRWQEFLAEEAE